MGSRALFRVTTACVVSLLLFWGCGGGTPDDSAAGGAGGTGADSGASGGDAANGGTGGDTTGGAGSGATGGSAGTGGVLAMGPCAGGVSDGRVMECLDRGVVAVPSENGVLVSWRFLGTDPADIAFRLYRGVPEGEATLVCERGTDEATSCVDDVGEVDDTYFVRPVLGSTEGEASGVGTYSGEPFIAIPLEPASAGAFVHLGWVGDLDGSGEYDVVVNRISAEAPLVDAYSLAGEHLWRLDTGPNGVNQNNIEGGATTMSNGQWDGLTVFDFDGDGAAEIAVKTANGFVFGDGEVLDHGNDADQFVSILDGATGAEIARTELPDIFQVDGPLQCHFGAGYFDGVSPSLVTKCKNRVGSGGFNLVITTYDFDGAEVTERWRWVRGNTNAPDYHQIRVLDVDGDGKDDVLDGGFVLDEDGKMLYSLGPQGVVHGDRFHVTDMDPNRPGLEGWGIQQDNANGLETYYYDAATGEVLRKYSVASGPGGDMGRGTVADLFPDEPGMEYFSFNGMYSASSGDLVVQEVASNVPWPNFAIQWDGDTGSELMDQNWAGEWNIEVKARNTYYWKWGFDGLVQARGALPFYGDILGDWREEVLVEAPDHSELRLYSTPYETDVRLYTLVHNPQYRNSLTVHGYKQSHHVSYFMGFDMDTPPQPEIRLAPRK